MATRSGGSPEGAEDVASSQCGHGECEHSRMFLSESLPDVAAERQVSLPWWHPGASWTGHQVTSPGAAVGARAGPRVSATSGHAEGAEWEDATRGQARPAGRGGGAVCSGPQEPWTAGVGKGSPPPQAIAVRVGLFLSLAFTILFFTAQV